MKTAVSAKFDTDPMRKLLMEKSSLSMRSAPAVKDNSERIPKGDISEKTQLYLGNTAAFYFRTRLFVKPDPYAEEIDRLMS